MTIRVLTYHSENASQDQSWAGCCVLPNGKRLEIWFCGPTEEWVRNRAQAFYDREKVRQDQLYGSTIAAAANHLREIADDDLKKTMVDAIQASGRGAQFVGKVWMLNRATGERARVLPAEVADYAAKGFERGGPRSK